MTKALEMVGIARTGLVAAAVLVGGGQAAAQRATQPPTPEVRATLPLYGQLFNGDWVMARGGQLFFVGESGVRSLCPDGDYRLKSGSHVKVKGARLALPWVTHGFAPQPEPPGKLRDLRAQTADGRHLVISGGRLFLAGEGAQRTLCPDGVYALAGGGSVRVGGGLILDQANLQGFAP